jgi:hypothetical protein
MGLDDFYTSELPDDPETALVVLEEMFSRAVLSKTNPTSKQ